MEKTLCFHLLIKKPEETENLPHPQGKKYG